VFHRAAFMILRTRIIGRRNVLGLSNQAHHAQLRNPGVRLVSLVLGAQQSHSGLIDRMMHASKTERSYCMLGRSIYRSKMTLHNALAAELRARISTLITRHF
jgi:hypothetical protein